MSREFNERGGHLPKLNVLAVVKRVLLILFDGGFLIRAAGIWFVVIAAVDAIGFLFVPPGAALGLGMFLSIAIYIVKQLALAACAVAVHRAILLRESPFRLRLGRTEICYILRAIVVWLPFVGLLILAVFIGTFVMPVVRVIAGIVAGVLVAALVLPFALSLPALAIGNSEFDPGEGLDASHRNIFREIVTYLYQPPLTETL
jgi:hypothetical protein